MSLQHRQCLRHKRCVESNIRLDSSSLFTNTGRDERMFVNLYRDAGAFFIGRRDTLLGPFRCGTWRGNRPRALTR